MNIYLIGFFSLYELFPAFICVNKTETLVNSLFIVKVSIPFPSFTFLSPSSELSDSSSADSS